MWPKTACLRILTNQQYYYFMYVNKIAENKYWIPSKTLFTMCLMLLYSFIICPPLFFWRQDFSLWLAANLRQLCYWSKNKADVVLPIPSSLQFWSTQKLWTNSTMASSTDEVSAFMIHLSLSIWSLNISSRSIMSSMYDFGYRIHI